MKTLILAAVRCSLMFTAVTASLFSVQPAQAYTVTLQQVGSNVVATGSGAINLTGLTFVILRATPMGGDKRRYWEIRRGRRGLNIDLTVDSPDRRVSGAGARSLPTLAAETLSAFIGLLGWAFCRATGLCLRCCSIG